MPFLLHYAPGVSGGFLGKRVVLLPLASETSAGLSVAAGLEHAACASDR